MQCTKYFLKLVNRYLYINNENEVSITDTAAYAVGFNAAKKIIHLHIYMLKGIIYTRKSKIFKWFLYEKEDQTEVIFYYDLSLLFPICNKKQKLLY